MGDGGQGKGGVRAEQVSSGSHLNIIKTPAFTSNSVIKRETGARGEGDEGMKEWVESGRSETGSGEKRRTRAPPSESGRVGAGVAAGKGRVSVWRGCGGREGGPAKELRCAGSHPGLRCCLPAMSPGASPTTPASPGFFSCDLGYAASQQGCQAG